MCFRDFHLYLLPLFEPALKSHWLVSIVLAAPDLPISYIPILVYYNAALPSFPVLVAQQRHLFGHLLYLSASCIGFFSDSCPDMLAARVPGRAQNLLILIISG